MSDWKQMREAAGLSQAAFGAKVGYGQRQIRSFEMSDWKQMREAAGLSQAAFGVKVGYGQRQIRSFECYGAKVPAIVQSAYRKLRPVVK